jgi:hypothetical protein
MVGDDPAELEAQLFADGVDGAENRQHPLQRGPKKTQKILRQALPIEFRGV